MAMDDEIHVKRFFNSVGVYLMDVMGLLDEMLKML